MAILGVVFALFVWPIVVGFCFLVCTGLPVYLLMKGFEYTGDILTLAFSKLLVVPILGRIFRIFLSLVIGFTLIGLVTMLFALPIIGISILFINGEASEPDVHTGWWGVDFYCKYFKWLAHMCNCNYLLWYSETAKPFDNPIILMWQVLIESIPMCLSAYLPWLFNFRILIWMIMNWADDS